MYPHLISFGSWHLATYGVLVATGYLIGILWLKTQMPWMPKMDEGRFWVMIYGLFFGAIMGGKVLYLAVNFEAYRAGEIRLFRDFRYGFVFFGGLLGAMAMGILTQRWIGAPYLACADYFGVALPMGHWLGRLGCLASGCCYGKPTELPWGIALGGDPASSTPRRLWGVALHPTQLYESIAVLAIWLFLHFHLLPRVKKKKLAPGTVFLSYIALYSAARFVIEFFRGDDIRGSWGCLHVSQWIAIAVILGSGAAMSRIGVFARR